MTVALGCSSTPAQPPVVDPFDCQVISPSGFPHQGVPLDGEVQLDFTDHQFGHGTAPTRMKGMVLELAIDRVALAACGRDTQNREWQITASWSYLPIPLTGSIEFWAYPVSTGENVSPSLIDAGLPHFGATLEYCGSSCARREWLAFDGPYFPNSNIQGTARVEKFEYCGGNFTGSAQIAYISESRKAQGPMKLSVSGTWTPTSEVSDGNVNPQTGKTGMIRCANGAAGSGIAGAAGTAGIVNATQTSGSGGNGGTSGS